MNTVRARNIKLNYKVKMHAKNDFILRADAKFTTVKGTGASLNSTIKKTRQGKISSYHVPNIKTVYSHS